MTSRRKLLAYVPASLVAVPMLQTPTTPSEDIFKAVDILNKEGVYFSLDRKRWMKSGLEYECTLFDQPNFDKNPNKIELIDTVDPDGYKKYRRSHDPYWFRGFGPTPDSAAKQAVDALYTARSQRLLEIN